MVDAADVPGRPPLAWPVIGNFPGERGIPFSLEQDGQVLKVASASHGIRTGIEISLPGPDDSGGALDDHVREPLGPGATDQGRAVPGMGPQPPGGRPRAHAVQPAVRRTRVVGPPARRPGPGQAREDHGLPRCGSRSGRVPDLAARFHRPRPQPLGAPGARNAAFSAARDTRRAPDFDPIASLLIGMTLPARGSSSLRLLMGFARDKRESIDVIARHLGSDARICPGVNGCKASSTRSGMAKSRRGRRNLTMNSPRTTGGC